MEDDLQSRALHSEWFKGLAEKFQHFEEMSSKYLGKTWEMEEDQLHEFWVWFWNRWEVREWGERLEGLIEAREKVWLMKKEVRKNPNRDPCSPLFFPK